MDEHEVPPHLRGYFEPITNLKAKSLVGIPWRVALALQDDGWWLRSEIIWAKENALPESVTDRPTRSHEQLFLLARSRRYYYDAAAIATPAAGSTAMRAYLNGGAGLLKTLELEENGTLAAVDAPIAFDFERVNRRDVWTFASEKSPYRHFAVMPQALVTPCVLAGSRPGDVVLDPFVGTGTVARVAKNYGRDAVGIDLSPDYLEMARSRLQQDILLRA